MPRIPLLTVVVIIILHYQGLAQSPVVLDNTQEFKLTSEVVDDEFKIQVSLPFGYDASQKNYPVIYVLDANVTFGMVRDIQNLISFEPANPAAIVVGIGYRSLNEWFQKRARDFMGKPVTSAPGSGGADKFLSFLKKELIPEINKRFRVNNTKTIYGHSSAALFCLYSLFKNPSLFNNYIATSPSVDEDENYTIDLEKNFKEGALLSGRRIYISYGDAEKETFQKAYQDFVKNFTSRNHSGLKIKSAKIRGTHMVSMAPALVRGLTFINDVKD